MGWERKRGKIEEFNRLLRGADRHELRADGRRRDDPAAGPLLHHARQRHAAAARCGASADRHHHASSEPRRRSIPALGRVTEGYGILQPRVSVTFTSAAGSLSRASTPAIPASTRTRRRSPTPIRTCSAKASSRAKACTTSTPSWRRSRTRFPENALLSHDLFEGLHARVALVSDVELVDEYPSSVLAHARRQHRWIRGDWQILLWLFPFVPRADGIKRNPFSADLALEDPRQPAPQPGRADVAGAAGRWWTLLPGAHWFWTDAGAVGDGVAAAAADGPDAGRAAPGAVVPGVLAEPPVGHRRSLSRRSFSASPFSPITPGTLPRNRADAGPADDHQTPAARMGDGCHRRGARSRILGGGQALLRFAADMMASPLIAPRSHSLS